MIMVDCQKDYCSYLSSKAKEVLGERFSAKLLDHSACGVVSLTIKQSLYSYLWNLWIRLTVYLYVGIELD